jgi:hypothetical protein
MIAPAAPAAMSLAPSSLLTREAGAHCAVSVHLRAPYAP